MQGLRSPLTTWLLTNSFTRRESRCLVCVRSSCASLVLHLVLDEPSMRVGAVVLVDGLMHPHIFAFIGHFLMWHHCLVCPNALQRVQRRPVAFSTASLMRYAWVLVVAISCLGVASTKEKRVSMMEMKMLVGSTYFVFIN